MVENLRTTRLNDSTSIKPVNSNTDWQNLYDNPGYCWYNYDANTYKNIFGAMYNSYAIKTGKLAPIGWHVPSTSDGYY